MNDIEILNLIARRLGWLIAWQFIWLIVILLGVL